MRVGRKIGFVAALVLIAVAGCGGGGPRKEPKGMRDKIGHPVKVTGQVFLDGKPTQAVLVYALNAKEIPQQTQWLQSGSRATTAGRATVAADGKFEFSSYEHGDGLPAGSYVLLFKKVSHKDDNEPPEPDVAAFNAKYFNPEASEFPFTLEVGQPKDFGKIELTSP